MEDLIVLCDQGGSRMDVLNNLTATLRATANHPPLVLQSYGFKPGQSAKARSLGYEKEKSPTLSLLVPAVLVGVDDDEDL